jgi:hypothetical protein
MVKRDFGIASEGRIHDFSEEKPQSENACQTVGQFSHPSDGVDFPLDGDVISPLVEVRSEFSVHADDPLAEVPVHGAEFRDHSTAFSLGEE